MCRDLIQHMIEETNASRNLVTARFVQIHIHADLCFLGVSDHMRFAAFIQQHVTDVIPVAGLWIITNTMDAHVFCQLYIGNAIADHIRVRMINAARMQVIFDDAQFWLAAGTVIMREVRTDQHGFPVHTL